MGLTLSISMAVIVIIAGMFLLAKTRSENLGTLFNFASYSSILIGCALLIGTITCGICKMMCNNCGNQSSKCSQKVDAKCGATKSCAKWQDNNSCKKGPGKSSYNKKENGNKKGKCCKGKSGKKDSSKQITKEVITDDEGNETVKVEIEINE